MWECLLSLLSDMKDPEMFLFLETSANGSQWKRLRETPNKHKKGTLAGPERTQRVEEAIVDIYFAHLSQWCQPHMQGGLDLPAFREQHLVRCPKALLEHLNSPAFHILGLRGTLCVIPQVQLQPGNWQNRPGVLRWQPSFAVWRKRGCWSATLGLQGTVSGVADSASDLPPDYYDSLHEASSGPDQVAISEKPPEYMEAFPDL